MSVAPVHNGLYRARWLPNDRMHVYIGVLANQSQLVRDAIVMPAGEQSACDDLLAEVICGSGVPFDFVSKALN
jgi:hypothetical protein